MFVSKMKYDAMRERALDAEMRVQQLIGVVAEHKADVREWRDKYHDLVKQQLAGQQKMLEARVEPPQPDAETRAAREISMATRTRLADFLVSTATINGQPLTQEEALEHAAAMVESAEAADPFPVS